MASRSLDSSAANAPAMGSTGLDLTATDFSVKDATTMNPPVIPATAMDSTTTISNNATLHHIRSPSRLLALPQELKSKIVDDLTYPDLLRLRKTCRTFRDLPKLEDQKALYRLELDWLDANDGNFKLVWAKRLPPDTSEWLEDLGYTPKEIEYMRDKIPCYTCAKLIDIQGFIWHSRMIDRSGLIDPTRKYYAATESKTAETEMPRSCTNCEKLCEDGEKLLPSAYFQNDSSAKCQCCGAKCRFWPNHRRQPLEYSFRMNDHCHRSGKLRIWRQDMAEFKVRGDGTHYPACLYSIDWMRDWEHTIFAANVKVRYHEGNGDSDSGREFDSEDYWDYGASSDSDD